MFVDVVIVVIVDAALAMAVSFSAERFAMARVMAGPGLSSMSPDSRRNRQNNVLRFILPSRGLYLVIPAAVVIADRTAADPKLGRFVEVSRRR